MFGVRDLIRICIGWQEFIARRKRRTLDWILVLTRLCSVGRVWYFGLGLLATVLVGSID